MRILLISHDSYLHGATRSLIDIADSIRGERVETLVFIPHEGLAEDLLLERKIPYEKASYPQLISYGESHPMTFQLKKIISALKHFPEFLKRVRMAKPDIIYVNTLANYWVLLLRLFINIPVVFHIREFGQPDHQLRFFLGGFIFRIFRRFPDLIICNSRSVAAFMNEHYHVRSTVVYNGVLLQAAFARNFERRMHYRSESNLSGRVNIGIVGNISAGKGQLEVVRAFHQVLKRNPRIHLFIVGDGDRRPVEDYITTFGLEPHISITGFLTDISDYYAMCDIIIVNSKMEAFGRVSVEAASFGIPVIGKNTGATPEIIIDRKTGLLYDGSEDDLARRIEELVVDPQLQKTLGRNAWEHAGRLFSLEKHIRKMRRLFDDLLRKEEPGEILT